MPITISGSTGIAGVDGSASTPAVQGTDTNTGIFFPAADTIAFGEGGSEAMRIDSSGNVGIGTSSPGRRLDVQQASADYQLRLGDAGSNYYDIGRNTTNGLLTFYGNQAVASGYVFSTVNGERARIDSSGNLLVGTTDADPFNNNSNTSADDGVSIKKNRLFCASYDGDCGALNRTGSDGTIFVFNRSGATVGSISVTTTGTAYNTSSDYRLKHDVRPLTSGLATIAALKPSTYKWNVNDSYGEGFIAHELQAVIPHAVSGEKDAVNEDGSIKSQGVDYSKIVVHLVAAIQELTTKLEAAEARIAALEAK